MCNVRGSSNGSSNQPYARAVVDQIDTTRPVRFFIGNLIQLGRVELVTMYYKAECYSI